MIRIERNGTSGYTLVEVLISVGIIGLIGAAAFPEVARQIENNRIEQAANDVLADLRLAREEAVAQKLLVTVSFSNSPPRFVKSADYDLNGTITTDEVTQRDLPQGGVNWTLPSGEAVFSPRGEFVPTSGTHWAVLTGADNRTTQYLYVFASGQIVQTLSPIGAEAGDGGDGGEDD